MSLWKKPLLIASAVLAMAAFAVPSAASASELWHDGENNPLAEAAPTTGGAELTVSLGGGAHIICGTGAFNPSVAGFLWNEGSAAGMIYAIEFANKQCVLPMGGKVCEGEATTNLGAGTGEVEWPLASLGGQGVEISNIEIDIHFNPACTGALEDFHLEGSLAGYWNAEAQQVQFNNANGLENGSGYSFKVNGQIALENSEVGPFSLQ